MQTSFCSGSSSGLSEINPEDVDDSMEWGSESGGHEEGMESEHEEDDPIVDLDPTEKVIPDEKGIEKDIIHDTTFYYRMINMLPTCSSNFPTLFLITPGWYPYAHSSHYIFGYCNNGFSRISKCKIV